MSNNTRLAELMNYITIDTTSGTQLQVSGSIKQNSVTSALLKAGSTGALIAATAGTDYLTSVGISNLTATGTPSSTTYLRGDNTWATVSAGASSVSTLTDVVLTSVANGDVLQYNSSTSKWVNAVVSGASGVTLNTAQTITGVKTFYGSSTDETPTFGANALGSTGWATGVTGWTGSYPNWTVVGAGSGTMTNSTTALSSTFYVLSITATTSVAGKYLSCTFGGSSFFIYFGSTGTQTVSAGAVTTTTGSLSISATAFDGTISNISIKLRNNFLNPVTTFATSTGINPVEIRIDAISGGLNTFMGYRVGRSIWTGYKNTGFGNEAFSSLQTGHSNVAIGWYAQVNNVIAFQNTAVGTQALALNVKGQDNVAVGFSSLSNNVANFNTALGSYAAQNITTGTGNVALGIFALVAASAASASNNVAIGYSAMYNAASNLYNVAIGYSALEKLNGTGSYNIAIGYQAGYYISGGATFATTIDNSIFIGTSTKPLANTQTNQIVIGYQTTGLGSNTTVLGNSSTTLSLIYGNLGVGSTPTSTSSLNVGKNITGGTTAYGILQNGVIQSDVTVTGYGIGNTLNTQAASYSIANYRHFSANQGTIGASSTVANQYGFYADSSLTSAINNYGFYGALSVSFTDRWNLYMVGTAPNYLASILVIGSTSPNSSALLQIDSTTKGVLFPRMTTAQKNGITTPAAGLVVYDTDLAKLCVRTVSAWETITSA